MTVSVPWSVRCAPAMFWMIAAGLTAAYSRVTGAIESAGAPVMRCTTSGV